MSRQFQGDRRAAPFAGICWRSLRLNTGLNLTNASTGRPWWAFWPLLVTGMLLGLHYLLYKAMTVDEHWAEERIEELNLKSYDRSHIEELKSRFGGAPDRKG